MNLKKMLTVDSIRLRLRATSKSEALEELLDIMVENGQVRDREQARQAVLEREQKMSTGMQNGIAIPHGKTDAVDRLQIVVALQPDGIDFDALDGQPCTIFIFTLSPANRAGPHIQFLAEISKFLVDDAFRKKLLNATSSQEILQLLTH